MNVLRGCLADNVGAEVAVAALEHGVRVPEVGAGCLGHKGIAEPYLKFVLFSNINSYIHTCTINKWKFI
jgi:hypothetical protein